MKSNSVINTQVNASIRTIEFSVVGAGSVTLHLERVSAANLDYAAFHGFKQRISDAAALSRDLVKQPDGSMKELNATPANKLSAMTDLVRWYESGTSDWSQKRQPGTSQIGLLWRAVCELKPERSPDSIRESLASLKADETRALATNPKIKAVLDRIASEAAQGVNTDELLEAI